MYPANTLFCPKDGSRLTIRAENPLRCSICGQTYPENTNFCPADGGRLISQPPQSEGFTVAVTYSSNPRRVTYPKANLGDRIIASIFDMLFTLLLGALAIVLYLAGILQASAINSAAGIGIVLLTSAALVLPFGYLLVLDGLGRGQSWGKAALNLMVVSLDNNQPCGKLRSILRNFISLILYGIPVVGWIIEPLFVLSSKDGRKLGDLVANTQVIETRHYYQENQ
jgi:uncharacterized RDD family membrane protein YckC